MTSRLNPETPEQRALVARARGERCRALLDQLLDAAQVNFHDRPAMRLAFEVRLETASRTGAAAHGAFVDALYGRPMNSVYVCGTPPAKQPGARP